MTDSIALWAMVRNEADRLAPWIRYHRALGVGPILLFADSCTDDSVQVASGFPDVHVVEIEPRPRDERVSSAHRRLGVDARERALQLDCTWLLGIDVDEYAWGGSVEDLRTMTERPAIERGRLHRLIDGIDDTIEQIRLETLETVPVRQPLGRRPYATTWVQHRQPHVRALDDPTTGQPQLLTKFLGHQLGKTLVRTSVALRPTGSHGWERLDGSEPITEDAGLHLHYFAWDFESWVARWRQRVHLGDTWDGVIERPFPHNEWRDFVASGDEATLRTYFDGEVCVDARVLEAAASDHLFPTTVVPDVLDAIKPNDNHKLVVVGLDCFDVDLFETWAAKGLLPTLAAVSSRSAYVDTVGPPGTYVSAIWPDFYSGVSVAKHGNQCWKQLARGTYDFEWHRVRDSQTRRVLWDALGQAGYDCAIVDAPLTPGWAANRLQVFEWGTHDPDVGFAAFPEGLDREVRALVGGHGVDSNCNQYDRTPAEIADFRDRLVEGARKRSTLANDMYQRDDWDFFLTSFSEAHCAGHQTWHYHDDGAPGWVPENVDVVGDPIERVYRAIDAGLGDFLEQVDDDATVAVWLSHGMGNHTYPTYLNDSILYELDRQRHRRELARAEHLSGLRGDEQRVRSAPEKDDLGSRLFFHHMNNDPEAGVRLNVVGREPRGLIEPGRDFDQMCDWLAQQYFSLTDVVTGEPLVDDVLFTADLYEGDYLVDLPDLLIQWRRTDEFIREVHVGDEVVRGAPTSCRTGDHHPRGRLFVYGPRVAPGRAVDDPLPVRDLTALFAGFYGVEMDMDGAATAELVERVFGSVAMPIPDSPTVSSRPTTRRPSRGCD